MSVNTQSLLMEKHTASFADMSPPRPSRINTSTTSTTNQKPYILSTPPHLPARQHAPTDSSADSSPLKERRSFYSSTKVESYPSFRTKLRACFRGLFLCCTGCDGDEGASKEGESSASAAARRNGSIKGMMISAPTNFRREEVHIAGLTPEQEHIIRLKASTGATRQWTTLSPLRSLPSGTFASRPVAAQTISSPTTVVPTDGNSTPLPPTYEESSDPRTAPAPATPREGGGGGEAKLRVKVRSQGRRMSGNNNFSAANKGRRASVRVFSSSSTGSGVGQGVGLGVVGRGGAVPNFDLPRTPPMAAGERGVEFPVGEREREK